MEKEIFGADGADKDVVVHMPPDTACPYFAGSRFKKGGGYVLTCQTDKVCKLNCGNDGAYIMQMAKCTESGHIQCRCFLFTKLKEAGLQPSSDHGNEELRNMYDGLMMKQHDTPQASPELPESCRDCFCNTCANPCEMDCVRHRKEFEEPYLCRRTGKRGCKDYTPPLSAVPEAITISPSEPRSITDVTAEIRYYKAQTVQNIIEIGKRLIEAKELLEHGQWSEWLKISVEFSHETANRFMRLATEYSNSSPVTNLSYSNLLALLAIPTDDRDDFIEATHVVDGEEKTVDEMSKRELQRVIKERDEAIKRAEQAESTVDSKQKSVLSWQAEAQSQIEKFRLLKDENRRQRLDIDRLENQPIDVAVQQPTEAQLEAMREEIRDELRNEFADNAPPETYLSKKALENADGSFYDAVIGAEALLLGAAGQMDVKRAEQMIDNCVSILEGIVSRFRKKKDLLMEMDRRINPDSYDVDF